MTPIDHEITTLVDRLLPLLRERGIRHTSLFTDGGEPRIYFSHGTYSRQTESQGNTVGEALEALDAALDTQRLLETLY
jgi:hypothetical protein